MFSLKTHDYSATANTEDKQVQMIKILEKIEYKMKLFDIELPLVQP